MTGIQYGYSLGSDEPRECLRVKWYSLHARNVATANKSPPVKDCMRLKGSNSICGDVMQVQCTDGVMSLR
jgi:hypothetical protein